MAAKTEQEQEQRRRHSIGIGTLIAQTVSVWEMENARIAPRKQGKQILSNENSENSAQGHADKEREIEA